MRIFYWRMARTDLLCSVMVGGVSFRALMLSTPRSIDWISDTYMHTYIYMFACLWPWVGCYWGQSSGRMHR